MSRFVVAAVAFLGLALSSCDPGAAPSAAARNHHERSIERTHRPGAQVLRSRSRHAQRRFHVLDLSFVDTRHGFALGELVGKGWFERVKPHVMAVERTSDGGRTWRFVAPAPPSVDGALFSTSKLGWAYGSGLFATLDGGQTWSRRSPGGRVRQLALTSRALWAVVARCPPFGSCTPHLAVSADGGATWRATGPRIAERNAGMTWLDAMHGWVWSTGAGQRGKRFLSSHVFATSDGGRSWNQLATPCRHQDELFGATIAAGDAEHLWMFCVGESVSSTFQFGQLGVSTNGGRTWKTTGYTPWPAYFDDIVAPSPRHALLAASADGGTALSSVVGLKLRPREVGLEDAAGILSFGPLLFVDARHGWLADDDRVYRTVDGGHHWTGVRLLPPRRD